MSMEKEKKFKTKNKEDQINIKDMISEKYEQIIKKEKDQYINEIIELYETEKFKLQKEIEDLELNNKDTTHKSIILKNLDIYYKDVYNWKNLPYVSEYERPPPLCFHKITLSDDEIKEVHRILSNELSINISTSNILLVGLYYGIGIYVKTLPVGYLRFLQKCAQNRKIGIMLSDRTLSMGISMPFLSVLLYQHNDTEFVQMEAVQNDGTLR